MGDILVSLKERQKIMKGLMKMREKYKVPREFILAAVLVINSMGVQFMTKSGFGISAISSVPYVFSHILDFVSFGTWNYIFQSMLVLSLMVISKKMSAGYIVSFAAGFVFGKFIDVHSAWISCLPDMFALRMVYFLIGIVCISVGICMANKCLMPIIPTDMFPRDFSEIKSIKYQKVKTTFDLSCLMVTVVLSLAIEGALMGVGIGTLVCSLFTGKMVAACQKVFDRYFETYRMIEIKFNVPARA